jgi:S1-C subfamily serine protease/thioredoxin-like negative regulator of GroEL
MIMFSSVGLRSLSLMGIFFLNFWISAANANNLQLASVYVDAGRYSEAVAILKKYEATEEEEYKVNLLTGKIYLAIDKPAKALEFFEAADVQSLDNIDAQIGIALSQLKLGKFSLAKRYADSIRRTEKDVSDPIYINAVIQARTGKLDEAIKGIEQIAQRQPDSESIALARAKFYVLNGDPVKAKEGLGAFIHRKSESPEALDYLGEILLKSGDQAGAVGAKRRALQIFKTQSNQYKAAVMAAWLETNDPTKRQPAIKPEPKPEPAKPQNDQYVESKPEPKPAKPEKVKLKPSLPDAESNFAVQRFPFPAGVMITGGSGFIVDSGRKVVTNRHVVEGGKEFAIRTGLGEVIKAKVIFTSTTDDLAVLELDKPLPADRAIPSTNFVKPKVGRTVVVMGYPLWYMLGEGSPSLTNGVVSKRTGLKDDPNTFQVTAKVNKGNSGGPVFDMRGNVVGITVGKLDTKKISEDQGFVPEDVNFAIHVDRLPKIVGIAGAIEDSKAELSAEELYQAVVGKVVMVATYKY